MVNVKRFCLMVALASLAPELTVSAAMEPGTFKLGGKGYFFYENSFSDGGAGQSNAFDFSRLYFGAKFQISEKFVAQYMTDMAHDDGGVFETFAKYALLDWKIDALSKWDGHLVMGLQSTYNWKIPEAAWGYRSIRWSPMESLGKYFGNARGDYDNMLGSWAGNLYDQETPADSVTALEVESQRANFQAASANKMASSADLGVALKIKPTDAHYVMLMVRNGGGYKKAETDMYKNYQVRVGFYLLDEKALHLSAMVELEPFEGVDKDGAAKTRRNLQWDVMASYEKKGKFLVAANVNSKKFPGVIDDVTATCLSGFGNVYLVEKKLKVLGRIDVYQTGFNDAQQPAGTAKMKSNAKLIIAGLDFMLDKNVHIIPNVQILTLEGDGDDVKNFFIHAEFKF